MSAQRVALAYGADVFQDAIRAALAELKAANPDPVDRRDPVFMATVLLFEILRDEIRALMEADGSEATVEGVEANFCRLLILAGDGVVERAAGTA